MRKFMFSIIVSLLVLLSLPVYGADSIKLIINGVDITSTMDVKPQIIDGRTMVPTKYVAENLGATVEWNAESSAVIIKSTDYSATKELVLSDKNSIKLIVNGIDITPTMDVKPQIMNDRTMVPAKYVAENLDATVEWDAENAAVIIAGANSTAFVPVVPVVPPKESAKPADKKDSTPSADTYVGSEKSDKYHYPHCLFAKNILPENQIWFSTKSEAENQGYLPCKTCF